jgi:hypothetical protein
VPPKFRPAEGGLIPKIRTDRRPPQRFPGQRKPAVLPNIKNLKAYTDELKELPDWRIGCIFTGKAHRREGVARAAVAGAWKRSTRQAVDL